MFFIIFISVDIRKAKIVQTEYDTKRKTQSLSFLLSRCRLSSRKAKVVQTEHNTKRKTPKSFIFIVEVPPIFAKGNDSANRVQYKKKDPKSFIFIVEVPPIFATSKDSANRAQYKMKSQKTFIFMHICGKNFFFRYFSCKILYEDSTITYESIKHTFLGIYLLELLCLPNISQLYLHLRLNRPQKPQKNRNFAQWGKYAHIHLYLCHFFPLKTIIKNNHDNECSRKLHAPTEANG